MSTIVEFHNEPTPRTDMLSCADAGLVVICHGGDRYTVWKDREGTTRRRVPWVELLPHVRKALAAEVKRKNMR